MSRHLYDICQIADTPLAEEALADKDLYHSLRDAQHAFHAKHFVGIILPKISIAGSALTTDDAFIGEFNTRTGSTVFVEELYLKQPAIILLGQKSEFDAQLLGGGYLALYTGIVEGVAVAQGKPITLHSYWRIEWGINVPGC